MFSIKTAATLLLLVTSTAKGVRGLKCFQCGYQKNMLTGNETAITGTKFCGDYVDDPSITVSCQPEDCCVAIKSLFNITENGEEFYASEEGRHDCESNLDLGKYDYECKKAEETGEACKDYEIDSLPDGHDESQIKATLCFCDSDECNNRDPQIDNSTTTSDSSSISSTTPATTATASTAGSTLNSPSSSTTTSSSPSTTIAEGLKCFKCGYQKNMLTGNETAINGTAFCEDYIDDPSITVICPPKDCCVALKTLVNITDNGQEFYEKEVGRHDCESNLDVSQYDYECKKAQDSGEACKVFDADSLPDNGDETQIRATLCFCDTDECNNRNPEIPTTTHEPSTTPGGGSQLTAAAIFVASMALFAAFRT